MKPILKWKAEMAFFDKKGYSERMTSDREGIDKLVRPDKGNPASLHTAGDSGPFAVGDMVIQP